MEGEVFVTKAACLMKGEWSYYRNRQFNGGKNSHVTEVANLKEGEWSCYRGGQFNGERKVMFTEVVML